MVRALACGLVCALLAPLGGCWLFSRPAPPPAGPKPAVPGDLPADIDELLELAEQKSYEDSPLDDVVVAVAALEKVRRQIGQQQATISPMEVDWRLARACFLAAEREKISADKLVWIAKGEDAAEAAIRARPDRVEGYYYSAVLTGRRAEDSGIGFAAMMLARRVEDLGLKAVEIDPAFEDGGPCRLLAMLYAKAPPWPTSIGDIDEAMVYGEKAIAISDYPLNHLFMAEVLIEADELGEARTKLKQVLSAPKVGRWARDGERWRPYARQLLKLISER